MLPTADGHRETTAPTYAPLGHYQGICLSISSHEEKQHFKNDVRFDWSFCYVITTLAELVVNAGNTPAINNDDSGPHKTLA